MKKEEKWTVYTTTGSDESETLTGSRDECLLDYADFHKADDENHHQYAVRVGLDAVRA